MRIETLSKYEKWFTILFAFWVLSTLGYALGLHFLNIFLTIAKLSFLIWGISAFTSTNKSKSKSIVRLMNVFIVYFVLSGVVYIFNDRPIICYIDGLINCVLPMFAFYCGYVCQNKDRMYMYIAIVFLIICAFTIIPYLTLSPWYLSYLSESVTDDVDFNEDYISRLRYSASFTDSYYVTYIGVPILAFAINRIVIQKQSDLVTIAVCIITIVSCLLGQQRTAMLFVFIVMFFYIMKSGTKYLMFFAPVVIISYFAYVSFTSSGYSDIAVEDLIKDRLEKMTFSEAFGEREGKVFRVFPVWSNYLFGAGLGVYGHTAYYNGFISVNDCAYIKLIVENRIFGICLFLYILAKSALRAWYYRKYFYCELLIFVFYIIAMTGSDALSMDIVHSIFFWYSIGAVWNQNLLSTKEDIKLKSILKL